MGLTIALLIGWWVKWHLSYDNFHANYDNLYRVINHEKGSEGELETIFAQSIPLGNYLVEEYPEVESVVIHDWPQKHGLQVDEQKTRALGTFTTPSILTNFSFELIDGDPKTALNENHSIVLSEKTANILFEDENPLGQIVRLDNISDLKVTGVMKNAPENSSLSFDFLVPHQYYLNSMPWMREATTDWEQCSSQVFVRLKAGTDAKNFVSKIEGVVRQHDDDHQGSLNLLALKDFHLRSRFKNGKQSGGFITYVKLFGFTGIFVLLIAIANFINLSTARSEKRAKEVGVRKTLGAHRNSLIQQFLGESVFTAFLAFVLAITIISLVFPYFNTITGETMPSPLNAASFWGSAILITIITGLLAGIYPAFFLSNFKPIDTLKNNLMNRQKIGGQTPRKILVTGQFAVSILLTISTIIVWQQVQHLNSRPKGYDAENLIIIESSNDLHSNTQPLNIALNNSNAVTNFTRSSSPINGVFSWLTIDWPGKPEDINAGWPFIATSWDYTKTLGIKILEGRDFDINMKTDTNAVLINRRAAELMQMENPVGKVIKTFGGEVDSKIVGVIDDVMMLNPEKKLEPTVITCRPNWTGYIMIRLNKDMPTSDAVAEVKTIFEQYNPAVPFEYTFADEAYAKKMQRSETVGNLSSIFGLLAIFISCLGLLGLAAFLAEQRTKELGIRKILGASISNLWFLLNKDFLKLIIIATLLASPIAFWLMQNWLADFDYRIDIHWSVFLLASGIVLVISVATLSVETIKAAIRNPVASLRDE